jgi:hypothetical protein
MPSFSISIFVPEPQFHPFLYPLRYWFFLLSLLHFSHALLSQQPSPPLGSVAYFGISAPFQRHCLHRLGGLFHSHPLLCLRLLLRLRAFQDFRKYASRGWATTCVKPHATTPRDTGTGPHMTHPAKAERASN